MSILSLYEQLRLTDRRALARWKKKYTQHQLSADEKKIFEQKVASAARRSLVPFCEKLKISYPEDLPVSKRKDELIEAIKNHSCVIVCGSTG